MTNQKKAQTDKLNQRLDQKEPAALDQAPDSNQHRHATAQDMSEVEKHRTNKSSGSLKEDSLASDKSRWTWRLAN